MIDLFDFFDLLLCPPLLLPLSPSPRSSNDCSELVGELLVEGGGEVASSERRISRVPVGRSGTSNDDCLRACCLFFLLEVVEVAEVAEGVEGVVEGSGVTESGVIGRGVSEEEEEVRGASAFEGVEEISTSFDLARCCVLRVHVGSPASSSSSSSLSSSDPNAVGSSFPFSSFSSSSSSSFPIPSNSSIKSFSPSVDGGAPTRQLSKIYKRRRGGGRD